MYLNLSIVILLINWKDFGLCLRGLFTLDGGSAAKSATFLGQWSVFTSTTKRKMRSQRLQNQVLWLLLLLPCQLIVTLGDLAPNLILRMSQNLAHLLPSHLQYCLKGRVISENSHSRSWNRRLRISADPSWLGRAALVVCIRVWFAAPKISTKRSMLPSNN